MAVFDYFLDFFHFLSFEGCQASYDTEGTFIKYLLNLLKQNLNVIKGFWMLDFALWTKESTPRTGFGMMSQKKLKYG